MKLQPRNKMNDETDYRTSATETTSNEVDYYRLASGFYLAFGLPDNYLELDDDTFYALLEQRAWQPFEGHAGENIAFHIENLSVAMENIARDTRKKTLDEVKAALNIES